MVVVVVVALTCLIIGFAIGVVVVLRSSGFFQRLTRVTNTLERTLGSPSEIGTWGEVKLRQVVELAGMDPWCDFDVQVVLPDGSRPDMVIRLPGGWRVIVDSKATLDPTGLRSRMRELADRRYWENLPGSLDFVILFIPLESALPAALQQTPSLLEEATHRNVIFATPATLVALLRFFANGWRQETLTRNAATVREAGEELYSRFGTGLQHATKFGRLLGQTVNAYNAFVGSVDSRLLPSVKRMHEHGIGDRDIEPAPPVDLAVRELRSSWPEEQPQNGVDDDMQFIVAEKRQVEQPVGSRAQSVIYDIPELSLAPERPALPITTDQAAGASEPSSDGWRAQESVESSQPTPDADVVPSTPVMQEMVNCTDHVHTRKLAQLAGLSPRSLGPYVSQGRVPAPAGWCWAVGGEKYWDNETAARWLAGRRYTGYSQGDSAEFISRYLTPTD
jgi:hypothetical protein